MHGIVEVPIEILTDPLLRGTATKKATLKMATTVKYHTFKVLFTEFIKNGRDISLRGTRVPITSQRRCLLFF